MLKIKSQQANASGLRCVALKYAGLYDVFFPVTNPQNGREAWNKGWTRVQVKRGSNHINYVNGQPRNGMDMLRIRKELNI